MPERDSFQRKPEYEKAKALYFSSTESLSIVAVAKRLRLSFSTVRYWAQKEEWKMRREAMLAEVNAQANNRSNDDAAVPEHNASAIVAVINQITELRAMSQAQLAKMMASDGVEKQRRYLAITRTIDLLLERVAQERRALELDRLSKAIATLQATADMLMRKPASDAKQRKDGPQRARRAPKADVAEARAKLGL